jgi:FixJ family two-component response regulator/HPt (histidine-containing phosphotransfer) domain-containing protein
MIDEFKIEAAEMFDTAEVGFLNLDRGENFKDNYNSIFRAFHSLKGAAGMFGYIELQNHTHNLESLFESLKINSTINKNQIDYFLSGIDAAKKILDGEAVNFTTYTPEQFHKSETLTNNATPVKEVPKEVIKTKTTSQNNNGIMYVVDDEPDVVEILSAYILQQGMAVKGFYNAKDALADIDIDNPDAILIDLNMPEISGLDFLKRCNEDKIEIPIILISGFLTKEIKTSGLESGAFAFIEKPFDSERDLATCFSAVRQQKMMKLLNKSINYILYQFSDLDQFLKQQGKDSMREALKHELESMLELKKNLMSTNMKRK